MPHDRNSHKLLKITTFIGDETYWNASMAVHGALAVFNPQEEDWPEYAERLTFYFTTNRIITDAKNRAVLLSCCRPATFRLLQSLGKSQ